LRIAQIGQGVEGAVQVTRTINQQQGFVHKKADRKLGS
jgi:hypothetical protein